MAEAIPQTLSQANVVLNQVIVASTSWEESEINTTSTYEFDLWDHICKGPTYFGVG